MDFRLVDTNIVSFRMKSHALFELYRPYLFDFTPAISFQTVGELLEGAELADWGKEKRKELEVTLQDYTIIESERSINDRWAFVRKARRSRPIGVADAWIAATALAYGLELVTHNPNDFAGIPGLAVITESADE